MIKLPFYFIILILIASNVFCKEEVDKKGKNSLGVSVSTFADPFSLTYKRYLTDKSSVFASGYIKYEEKSGNFEYFNAGLFIEAQRNLPSINIITFYPLLGLGWKYRDIEYWYSKENSLFAFLGAGVEIAFFKRIAFYADIKYTSEYRIRRKKLASNPEPDNELDIFFTGGTGIGIIF